VTGVFDGFAVIAVVIGVGVVLGHLGVVDDAGQRMLSALAFSVATPALLVTVLQRSDLSSIFSGSLLASAAAVVVVGAVSVTVSRIQHRNLGETVVGALTAGYCNAANLGLPIATYVLGDGGLVVPIMLLQIIVLQPVALTALDIAASDAKPSLMRVISRPLSNPITIGSLVGLVLVLSGWGMPDWLASAVTLVGGMSVPSMLLAYGVSLRLGPLPGRGVPLAELGWSVGLKLVVQPLLTLLLGLALGVSEHQLLAITVIAALPTAQNVFVIATRYERATILARDSIFLSTLLCVPVVLVASSLLT
jgi:predicted permease